MRILYILSFCLYFFAVVIPADSSLLSLELAQGIKKLVNEHVLEYQRIKDFKINNKGMLVAVDTEDLESVDLLANPSLGESLELLHIDKFKDRVYYKVTWNEGVRIESCGLFGENQRVIVPIANDALFSETHQMLYWSRDDAVLSTRLGGTSHNIIARHSAHFANELSDWVWLGEYPWAFEHKYNEWHWTQGEVLVLNQPLGGKWGQGLPATGVDGWTWWGKYPWVYLSRYESWAYIHGDIWVYSSKNSNWNLMKNTNLNTFDGIPTVLAIDESSRDLYFQLNPPLGESQSFGEIQRLDLDSGSISTTVDMAKASHLHFDSVGNRIFWSEFDGLHSASLNGTNRCRVITISKEGEPKPIIYKSSVPISPGTLYDITLSPYNSEIPVWQLELKDESKIFNIGMGKDFHTGNYAWARKPLVNQAQITLYPSQNLSTNYPSGTRYQGLNFNVFYPQSGGTGNLTTAITLQLKYRDNHTGTFFATHYLANDEVVHVDGEFFAFPGDFSGAPSPVFTPPHYENQTITKLHTDSEGQLNATLRNEVFGDVMTLRINSATLGISEN